MRSILMISLTALIAASGVAFALHRRAASSPTGVPHPCTIEVRGDGHFLNFLAKDVPVRHLAWAESEDFGVRYLQVATQNDHQFLYRIDAVAPPTRIELQRTEGLAEAFMRTASLHRVIRLLDGSILLHYVAEGLHADASLLSRVDPVSGRSIWHRRFPGNRSRFSITPQGATLLIHGTTPRFTCLRWVPSTQTAFEPTIEQVDPPEPALPVLDVLPLVDGNILISQGRMLYRGSRENGWQPLQTAPPSALHPRTSLGRITPSGSHVFWQPTPGTLYSLDPAVPSPATVPVELPVPSEPLDRFMLRLAGVDSEGRLWFDLQSPETIPTAQPLSMIPAESETGWKNESPTSGSEEELWKSHLARPLDRVYAWSQGSVQLRAITWSETIPLLGAPAELRATSLRLWPSQGIATTLEASPAWWIPLSSVLGKAPTPQPR